MRSIVKATALLSGSSVVSIFVSLVSAKILALCLQPAGYGYYGLLQSFVSVASLFAGLGMATGLVKLGAGAAASGDQATPAALRAAAWTVFCTMSVLLMIVLVPLRVPVSKLVTGSPNHGKAIICMGVAILFTVAGTIRIGILNSYHRVGALAKSAVATTLIGAIVSICLVLTWGVKGAAPAVLGGAIGSWLAAGYFLRHEVGSPQIRTSYADVTRAIKALVRFGTPYTASMLIGTGVQLALPILVVHLLSTASVGYYRAASAISVGYLGFLMTAMGQDYYPRLCAAGKDSNTIIRLINDQHRLIMIAATPIIITAIAVVPTLVPIVYSAKFQPAVAILEWQLIGDVFKFSSLTMAFAVLARSGSIMYFLIECVGGVTTLATNWIAVRLWGLEGLGMSFLLTYVIYYVAVWIVIRRQVPLVWSGTNKMLMLSALAAAILVRVLPATRFAAYRMPVALFLAAVAAFGSLLMVRREWLAESATANVTQMPPRTGDTAAAT